MFTIRRIDKFTTYLVPGTSHCGIGTGKNSGDGESVSFTYDAWVKIADQGLDDKGFVIDNKEFKVYFDQQTKTSLSCEMICKNAAKHFFKIAAGNDKRNIPNIQEVCVRIWGLPGVAYAEYMWSKEGTIATKTTTEDTNTIPVEIVDVPVTQEKRKRGRPRKDAIPVEKSVKRSYNLSKDGRNKISTGQKTRWKNILHTTVDNEF